MLVLRRLLQPQTDAACFATIRRRRTFYDRRKPQPGCSLNWRSGVLQPTPVCTGERSEYTGRNVAKRWAFSTIGRVRRRRYSALTVCVESVLRRSNGVFVCDWAFLYQFSFTLPTNACILRLHLYRLFISAGYSSLFSAPCHHPRVFSYDYSDVHLLTKFNK